jgi:small subunit ribosomal protein S4e
MKRIATPKSWMLSKLGGTWATRPSQGPHKLRECMPLSIILQHKLKYAMNGRECKVILNDKDGNIKVNFYLYLIFLFSSILLLMNRLTIK